MEPFNARYPDFPFPLPFILDGATGTEMIKAGMPAGVCPEKWIMENPEAILSLQKNYIDRGSNAVLTPTFGANRTVLSRYGLSAYAKEMNIALASLSRQVAKEKNALVGGDISPAGRFLTPVGDIDFEELVDVFKEQAAALSPLVDFFFLETNMDLASLRATVTAVREVSDKPVFVTLTVTEKGVTLSGDTPEAALLTLSELGIKAFGLNCSCGPAEMSAHLSPLVPLSLALRIPLIAKPNAGTNSVHLTPKEFAEYGCELANCGISILGGCCGTDPDYIAALSSSVKGCPPPSLDKTDIDLCRIACNNRAVVTLPEKLPSPLVPTEDFLDDVEEVSEDGFLYLSLPNREAANIVLSAAPFLTVPVAVCGEKNSVAYFKRRFCGRAPIIR